MAAQKGRDLLIKVRTATGTPDTFTTVAGIRTTGFKMNEETVDITNKDSNGFRELLAGRIVQSMSIAGAGVYKDESTFKKLQEIFLAGTHELYQLILPGTAAGAAGTFEGFFRITSLEINGDYNNEVNFTIALESDGEVEFTDLAA